jgi:hypothetical protein
MYEVFAVDPSSLDGWKELKALFDKFGFDKGSLLGKFPLSWEQMLETSFIQLSDIDSMRVKRLLEMYSGNMIPVKADFNGEVSWLDNALKFNKDRLFFKAIFSREGNGDNVHSTHDLLWEENTFLSPHTSNILANNINAYRQIIRPLLSVSPEVHLSDRYFLSRIGKWETEFLRKLIKDAANSGTCKTLYLHLGKNADGGNFERNVDQFLNDLHRPNFNVKRRFSDDLKHERILFSQVGGLHFDHGFGFLGKRAQTNMVSCLSGSVLQEYLDHYDPRTHFPEVLR